VSVEAEIGEDYAAKVTRMETDELAIAVLEKL
jgi:hypothetical protein